MFGVRVDASTNPSWVEVEEKQCAIEAMGFFVTSKKFGDEDEPGAITRLQEINKLDVKTVKVLMQYLALVGANQRPVVEKEMVMMLISSNAVSIRVLKLTAITLLILQTLLLLTLMQTLLLTESFGLVQAMHITTGMHSMVAATTDALVRSQYMAVRS